MRAPTSALITAILGAALAAPTVSAQQSSPSAGSRPGTAAATPIDPMTASRGARYLLRNGLDYVSYQEYERALTFLREAETRQAELSEPEKQRLRQGIARAQQGLREAINGVRSERTYARSGPRRAGAFAFAPAGGTASPAAEPIQLASATTPALPSGPAPTVPVEPAGPKPVEPASSPGPDKSTASAPAGKSLALESPAEASAKKVTGDKVIFAPVNDADAPPPLPDPGAPPPGTPAPAELAASQPSPVEPMPEPTPAPGPELTLPAPSESPGAAPLTSSVPDEPAIPMPAAPGSRGGSPGADSVELPPLPQEPPAPPSTGANTEPSPMPVAEPAAPTATNEPMLPADEPSRPASVEPAASAPVGATEPATAPATTEPTSAEPPTAPASGGSAASPMRQTTTRSGMKVIELSPSDEAAGVPDAKVVRTATSGSEAAAAPTAAPASEPVNPTTPARSARTSKVIELSRPDESEPAPVRALAPEPTEVAPTVGQAPALAPASEVANVPPAPLQNQAPAAELTFPPLPAEVAMPAPVQGSPEPQGQAAPAAALAKAEATDSAESDTPEQRPGSPLPPAEIPAAANVEAPAPGAGPAPEPLAPPPASPSANDDLLKDLPPLPPDPPPMRQDTPAPAPVPLPVPIPDPAPAFSPTPRPAPPGSTNLGGSPPARRPANPGRDSFIPDRGELPPSTLPNHLRERADQIAQRMEEEQYQQRTNPPPGGAAPGESASGPPSTRLEISRAPSPTEARPLRAIPVPEDFVPLAPRRWDASRKYWAAAATCHMPLYFQDAALERYGHNTEQFFGPIGRYLTYPVDDPTQSKQRNQIFQPLFSAGLFAAQVGLLPYNLIVDPPWEAEYDLGYHRPGDRVRTDIFYLPFTGVGPPLHGKNY